MARGALGTRGTRGARGGTGQVPGQAQRAQPAAEAPVLILPPRAGSFRVWPLRSARPASQPASAPVHLLRPAPPSAMPPPQEAPPLRPEPRKGTLRSSGAFLFLTGGSFSWSPALPRRRPLILTISPPSPYAIFISLPWTFPYNPSSCQRCLCPSKTRATCCKTRPSLHAMCQGRKALPPPGDRGSLFALGGPDSSLCPEQ